MAELKTKLTNASADDFVAAINSDAKREDSQKLLALFRKVTGEEPKMWGTSIIGFGSYHYKSERSSQEGDWPLTGFSPRKQNLTIYIMPGFDAYKDLLSKLGKHKTSVSCLYINKLADVDMAVLEKLVGQAYHDMKQQHAA
ncbi:DUF1801 domain-containing protein [Candidatus Saccharibacteria bacterium]|nr:DUF1801 domain-containing protein [Candidatus Saccharibacteria bacterium]